MSQSTLIVAQKRLEQGEQLTTNQAKELIYKRVLDLTREVQEVIDSTPEDVETITALTNEVKGINFAVALLSGSKFTLDI